MNKREKAVLARRSEIENACKRAGACTGEYKELLKSDDDGFINILKRNYEWCLHSRVLKLSDFGKKIHYKNSDDFKWWKEYDDKGNCIHCKNFGGDEWWSDKNKPESEEK